MLKRYSGSDPPRSGARERRAGARAAEARAGAVESAGFARSSRVGLRPETALMPLWQAAQSGAGAVQLLGPPAKDTASTQLRSTALSLAAKRALGGLLAIVDEPRVRDVLVHVQHNRGGLWIDLGGKLELVSGWSATPRAVRRLAVDLIAAGGRHIDDLNPCADVQLGDGIRVHAVLPPVAASGATVSIRLPRLTPLRFDEIVRDGLCDSATAALLQQLVATRKNILITGGTGSGKTTVLAALLDLSDSAERILLIEDVAELRLRHPHTVRLEARQANTEGVGEVTLNTLLREALRMRPDRIVLGECRGPEVATMLAALNTGHDGGAGTLHASRLSDVPARLEALGMLAGLDPHTLARQAVSALHAVVHLERDHAGHRVAAIGRLTVAETGELRAIEVTPSE